MSAGERRDNDCRTKDCTEPARFCDGCANATTLAFHKRRQKLEACITAIRSELVWAQAHPAPEPKGAIALVQGAEALERWAQHRGRIAGLERALELLDPAVVSQVGVGAKKGPST